MAKRNITDQQALEQLAKNLPGVDTYILCPLFNPYNLDWEKACRGGQTDLFRVIMHLNDHHKWSREKIADWLEQEQSAGSINIAFEENLFANGDNYDSTN